MFLTWKKWWLSRVVERVNSLCIWAFLYEHTLNQGLVGIQWKRKLTRGWPYGKSNIFPLVEGLLYLEHYVNHTHLSCIYLSCLKKWVPDWEDSKRLFTGKGIFREKKRTWWDGISLAKRNIIEALVLESYQSLTRCY